jgi:3'(2'), 5'-bisphosphate nucleotidase
MVGKSNPLNDPHITFAVEAVRRAGILVKSIQAHMVDTALSKEDRSPVTIADFASQALIGRLLSITFPEDALVGEEDSAVLQEPHSRPILDRITGFLQTILPEATAQQTCDWIDRGTAQPGQQFWTLDPIDGTKGFLRGDQYAVALAYVDSGQVMTAALGCPNLNTDCQPDFNGTGAVLVAAHGRGTWVLPMVANGAEPEPHRLQASACRRPSEARVLRSFESGHTNVSQIDYFAQALEINAEPVRMDSQAKYALLAAGQGELILRLLSPNNPDYREKIWDQAAGSLIVEEAGGKVSDLDGKPLDFTSGRTLTRNRGVLASNGHLHAPALTALKQIQA